MDTPQRDAIERAVVQVIGFHQELAAAKTGRQRTQLQRQLSAREARIDELVYELYGLTNPEISVVESTKVVTEKPTSSASRLEEPLLIEAD